MISQAKKLAIGSIDSARAITEGEFFSTNLENQLAILESLQHTLLQLQNFELVRNQLNTHGVQIDHILNELGFHSSIRNPGEKQNIPEERIIEFLAPRLQNFTIFDVGAHRGSFTAEMLKIGSKTVYAFEPHPTLSKILENDYLEDERVKVLPLALSNQDGTADLNLVQANDASNTDDPLLFSTLSPHNMPEELEFHDTVKVEMRSLSSLVTNGIIPPNAGILKVDAEGHDLMVFKGMPDNTPYEILMTEFWGDEFVFATPGIPRQIDVSDFLRDAGYGFSISFVRSETNRVSFQANRPVRSPKTWGNTLYFHDSSLFDAAYRFLKNLLPQTF